MKHVYLVLIFASLSLQGKFYLIETKHERKHRPYVGRAEIKPAPAVTKAPAAAAAAAVTTTAAATTAPAKAETTGTQEAAPEAKEDEKLEAVFRGLVNNVSTALTSGEDIKDTTYITWGKSLEAVVKLGKSETIGKSETAVKPDTAEKTEAVVQTDPSGKETAPAAEKKTATVAAGAKPAPAPPAATPAPAPPPAKEPAKEPAKAPATPPAAAGRIRHYKK